MCLASSEHAHTHTHIPDLRGIDSVLCRLIAFSMVAAMTPLPVIGVPVKSSALSGNDSLLSIVQVHSSPLVMCSEARLMCSEERLMCSETYSRVFVVVIFFAQMPRGVPVATVAIGNAANAGLLFTIFWGVALLV